MRTRIYFLSKKLKNAFKLVKKNLYRVFFLSKNKKNIKIKKKSIKIFFLFPFEILMTIQVVVMVIQVLVLKIVLLFMELKSLVMLM